MTLDRNLAHKDRFVYKLIQDLPGGCNGNEIVFPDNTTPVKFLVELSLNEATKLLSALMTGADLSYPNEAHEVVWIWLRQLECPVSLCDELTECLSPFFEALEAQMTALQNTVNTVREVQQANGTDIPAPIIRNVAGEICGGAAFVVDAMNAEIVKAYNAAETGAADNLVEIIPIIIELFPEFSDGIIDELFELANMYFQHQQLDYEDDFVVRRNDLIGSLRCYIEGNANEFTYDVWGQWLEFVGDEWAGDAAADVFSRFSPLAQHFGSDALAEATGNPSLREWFTMLYAEYLAGTTVPIACPTYVCPTYVCATPVLYPDEWVGQTPPNGANIQPVIGEDCYWTIDATTKPDTSEVIIFADSEGDVFRVEDITYPNGITTGQIIVRRNGVDVAESGTPPVINGITRFLIGFQSSSLPGQIKFKMTKIG